MEKRARKRIKKNMTKSFLFKGRFLELSLPDWYGWKNRNSCFFDVYLCQIGTGKTFSFQLLSLSGFHMLKLDFGANRMRYCFGCYLFSFFFDTN